MTPAATMMGGPMFSRVFSTSLATGFALCFSIAAHAQPGLSTKPNYDLIDKADRIDEGAQKDLATLHQRAVAALQAEDYTAAEKVATDLVQRRPSTPDANFLMGLAKIGLENWGEARLFLERAVAAEPRRPEPKTRLGLTLVKLDDVAAARTQREALMRLDADCKRSCPDSVWIADGLVLLDQALKAGGVAAAPAAPLASAAAIASASKGFDPAAYHLVPFDNTSDLYDLLTQKGRCPPNETADPRQPCALILYRPTDGSEDTLAANFKPVFKVVSRSTVWAIHDKKLQKVGIESLYFDNDDIIGRKRANYRSVALVGNFENRANCERGLACLAHLVVQDMFRMYASMPDSVVEVIWGAGMKDPGTVRIR